MPESARSSLPPECTLPLPDGKSVDVSLEDLENLWEQLPAIYQEGRARRLVAQMSLMDGTKFGLARHPNPFALKTDHEIVWTQPKALGIWPAGVPMLQFHEAPTRTFRQGFYMRKPPASPNDPDREAVGATWRLVFSRVPDVAIQECAWDDREGWERLARSLTSASPQSLLNLLLLQLDPDKRAEMDEIAAEVQAPAKALFAAAEGLPSLNEEDYRDLNKHSLNVCRVSAYDPSIFRYVEMPGMLLATAKSAMELKQLDSLLSQAGLVALKGFSTQGWGDIQRLAVKRGYRARTGKMPSDIWQVIGSSEAIAANAYGSATFSLSWFRNAVSRNLGVVDQQPLPWTEWRELTQGLMPGAGTPPEHV